MRHDEREREHQLSTWAKVFEPVRWLVVAVLVLPTTPFVVAQWLRATGRPGEGSDAATLGLSDAMLGPVMIVVWLVSVALAWSMVENPSASGAGRWLAVFQIALPYVVVVLWWFSG